MRERLFSWDLRERGRRVFSVRLVRGRGNSEGGKEGGRARSSRSRARARIELRSFLLTNHVRLPLPTLSLLKLTHSTHPPTTASLLPSTTHFLLPPPSYLAGQTYNKVGPPPRKLKIIDYPGHPRLAQGLKELIVTEIVKGGGSVSEGGKKGGVSVVFVVDGSGREKDVGGVVE